MPISISGPMKMRKFARKRKRTRNACCQKVPELTMCVNQWMLRIAASGQLSGLLP